MKSCLVANKRLRVERPKEKGRTVWLGEAPHWERLGFPYLS